MPWRLSRQQLRWQPPSPPHLQLQSHERGWPSRVVSLLGLFMTKLPSPFVRPSTWTISSTAATVTTPPLPWALPFGLSLQPGSFHYASVTPTAFWCSPLLHQGRLHPPTLSSTGEQQQSLASVRTLFTTSCAIRSRSPSTRLPGRSGKLPNCSNPRAWLPLSQLQARSSSSAS